MLPRPSLVIAALALMPVAAVPAELPDAAPAAQAVVSVDAKVALSAMIALTDKHIADMGRSLEVLAGTGEVQSGNWENMRGLLAALQERSDDCTVWFARPDGSYFNVDKGLTDQNLKDRPYFPKVMAGETSLGQLVISKSTGRKSVIAAVPVSSGGKVIGILGASIFLDTLSRRLKGELALPLNMLFFALDQEGSTTLHSVPERVFLDPRDQDSPSLALATDQMLMQPEGIVAYEFDGQRRTVVFKTSPLTGWRCAIGIGE